MIKILYIEDDQEIGAWLHRELTEAKYEVKWLRSGDGAISHLDNVDVVILDIMLPGLDGFTVGQRIKRANADIPILLLSARSNVDDKLQGLEFADDYVTKPFHPEEIIARIEVLLRRYNKQSERKIQLQQLTIYLDQNRIINEQGEEIILTGKQFYIFQYLLRHPNQILTKEQIYEAVWGEPFIEGDKALMVHIRHLREKIEQDPSQPTIVETIRGIGYRVKL
ncbi:DNA-binding response OmpR family regulator [Bacillus oleivorans]|uniref:DNA-binding response OmpR family regulator n=1 Tax=Bacillus oleivorans TaxID=1448271 RepID=A0A285CIR9_9BACI|nr:response regulator transcription factor [Bacillus oleivorans]SNX66898.1 DNA-binding response OmpR family regulator [Bacillus oleivorans]